jgi:hypothetical protein
MTRQVVWSLGGAFLLCCLARGVEYSWQERGAGLAMIRFTNAEPVIFTAVRVASDSFGKDLTLTTTLASNTVVGTEPLAQQIRRLPKGLGTPVAAINGDFFMMNGAAKGDPRGLHVFNGELVSVATGSAAFWQDAKGKLHGEPVSSRLTVTWSNAGVNLSGLNEELGTNSMVIFTPRMGALYDLTNSSNERGNFSSRGNFSRGGGFNVIPKGGPIRPPGGREWLLEHSGSGPWLPLRIGHTYQTKAIASFDGFTNVPDGKIILSLGPDALKRLPEIANGASISISVATEPNLSGIRHGLGTGPMLVREGKPYEVTARMSEQAHPRAAIGWNDKYLYLAVADGRQKGISAGLRLSEMADFMIDLGCEEAIDMDGGQSTTLMLNGVVINQPSSGRHDVANGIVVLRRLADEQMPED